PEQARGEAERIGPRTDVFGLGAVLYELLTGRPPYRGANPGEVLGQARAGRVTPPRQVEPRVPRALERICLKALAAEPGQRYAWAGGWGGALRGYRRLPRGRGGGGAAVLAGGAVLALWLPSWLAPPRRPAAEGPPPKAVPPEKAAPLTGQLRVRVW